MAPHGSFIMHSCPCPTTYPSPTLFFLRRKSIVQYLGCSNWMVGITGFSNKSCRAFACCNRVFKKNHAPPCSPIVSVTNHLVLRAVSNQMGPILLGSITTSQSVLAHTSARRRLILITYSTRRSFMVSVTNHLVQLRHGVVNGCWRMLVDGGGCWWMVADVGVFKCLAGRLVSVRGKKALK